jgi:hypothetical protein
MRTGPRRQVASRLLAVIVAALTLVVAGVEIWIIVDGISYQPRNCYVEGSTKIGVLGVLGGVALMIAVASAAYATRSINRDRLAVLPLLAGVGSTVLAFLCWAFVWVAASGC